MDNGEDKISERGGAIWNEHTSVVYVMIINSGWQTNITVCVFDKEGPPKFE
jgi:hypothetical protein